MGHDMNDNDVKLSLKNLADWHWDQATHLRKAAESTAMDKPEPCRSSLMRKAEWHESQRTFLTRLMENGA